jgi:hypothetical protein
MKSTTLQRIARRTSMFVAGLAGAVCLSTSVGNAQTTIQLTNWDGTVFPAHAHLYTTYKKCTSTGGSQVTVCEWYIRKLYGDNSAVVVTIHAPNGSDPACQSGSVVHIVSGYTRSSCAVFASAAVYGVN